ncbi:hypothetical protein MTO96_013914 [Rhipicephalus appendiculatus]
MTPGAAHYSSETRWKVKTTTKLTLCAFSGIKEERITKRKKVTKKRAIGAEQRWRVQGGAGPSALHAIRLTGAANDQRFVSIVRRGPVSGAARTLVQYGRADFREAPPRSHESGRPEWTTSTGTSSHGMSTACLGVLLQTTPVQERQNCSRKLDNHLPCSTNRYV